MPRAGKKKGALHNEEVHQKFKNSNCVSAYFMELVMT